MKLAVWCGNVACANKREMDGEYGVRCMDHEVTLEEVVVSVMDLCMVHYDTHMFVVCAHMGDVHVCCILLDFDLARF